MLNYGSRGHTLTVMTYIANMDGTGNVPCRASGMTKLQRKEIVIQLQITLKFLLD